MSSIGLDKLLVSLPSGMDLKKGVPENAQLSASSSSSFEALLQTQEMASNVETASSKAAAREEVREPEQSHESEDSDSKKEAKDASSKSEESSAEDASLVALLLGVSSEKSVEASLEEGAEGALPSVATDEKSAKGKAEILTAIATNKVVGEQNSQALAELPKGMEKLDAQLSIFEQRMANSSEGALELNGITGKQNISASSLKEFADKLWIQNHLEQDSALAGSLSANSSKVDITSVKSAPTVQTSQLVKDLEPLVSQVKTTKMGGEMSIQLRPGTLGRVNVELQVNDKQQVKIVMQAEQASAKSALESQVQELKSQLQKSGLTIDEVSVQLMTVKEADKGSSSEWKQTENREQRQQQSSSSQQQFSQEDRSSRQSRERDLEEAA